jgi:hypothetical protein
MLFGFARARYDAGDRSVAVVIISAVMNVIPI